MRGLLPDQTGFIIQHGEPLRHRQHLVPPKRAIILGLLALRALSASTAALNSRQDLVQLLQYLPKLLLLLLFVELDSAPCRRDSWTNAHQD